MSATPPIRLFEGFGVELEYMIVRAASLDVLPVADELLRSEAGAIVSEIDLGPISWSNELVSHVIELKTSGPAAGLEKLPAIFDRHVTRVNDILKSLGGILMPTAMHPWMDPLLETMLWPHDYSPVYAAYDRVFGCRGHGWSNLQSVHLNLPFADDEEFSRLHAAIRLVLPILPALAASSPMVDGKPTGLLDTRLDVYRSNSRRIPSITGQVIPEPVFSQADYERLILQRMYDDIAPLDTDGILQHEWLNSRGAIARFERSTIEIRLLDTQECPRADLAICAAIVAALKAHLSETWIPLKEQQSWLVEPLEAIFLATMSRGDQAVIDDPAYLAAFGVKDSEKCSAGDLWRRLVGSLIRTDPELNAAWAEPLDVILNEGPLARRIMAAIGPEVTRDRLAAVYRRLCACLSAGQMLRAAN